ncbi:MAG: hypothetical protein ACTSPI_05700, partial [Candidatus Heimdallarchaeaceae archaeon]
MQKDKYREMEISPFNIPFLRDLGIKVVSMITFDIIYGPICYLKQLSNSAFGNRLKKVESLAEIYAGFARTDFDVITSLDEKIVVSSYIEKTENSEQTVIMLFICVPTADTDKLMKYSRSLIERTKGNPKKFNDALASLIDEEKKSAHKIIFERNGNRIKGLTINDESVVSGKEFHNFHGFIFIDYNRSDIDGRFFPKIIQEKKMDLR